MDEMNLTAKKCTPCQGGMPPMTGEVAEKYLAEAPGWELRDDATKLKRTFKFGNFVDALGLAQHVGALCEAEGHHLALCSRPTKSTAYMKMTSLWQLKSTS